MVEPPSPRPRSSTGHVLLPAFDTNHDHTILPVASTRNLVSWTFGRGMVIWRIWPAVLLHTVFAAAVTTVSLRTQFRLGIPNVLLTVLGVVIGFVISYRASSGYDRYWQGRAGWSDLARTSRTFSRLVWIHVPLKIAPVPVDANGKQADIDVSIARRIMAEKRIALDLVEGFVVAVKHHLRGEMGIYYEDLYPFVKPLHNHAHHRRASAPTSTQPEVTAETVTSPIHDFQPEAPAPFALPSLLSRNAASAPAVPTATAPAPSTSRTLTGGGGSSHKSTPEPSRPNSEFLDPIVPPINGYGYGTLPPPLRTSHSVSSFSSISSDGGERRPLLPGALRQTEAQRGLLGSVAGDLIPFATVWRGVGRMVGLKGRVVSRSEEDLEERAGVVDDDQGGIQRLWADESRVNGDAPCDEERVEEVDRAHPRMARVRAKVRGATDRLGITHSKHRPRVAGGGENLPLEILRAMSIWLSVLDERGVVPGAVLGGMYGNLAAFEDSLSTLERILTTPLPFVYSVHIRHTVWIYLFFLPFQLIDLFGYYSILGTGIAAFIYLGLVAAGEEIEQPFGYDENDLDLDFFCNAIIHADIERIKRISCPNVYLGAHHSNAHGAHATTIPSAHESAIDPQTKVEAVFGGARHI